MSFLKSGGRGIILEKLSKRTKQPNGMSEHSLDILGKTDILFINFTMEEQYYLLLDSYI